MSVYHEQGGACRGQKRKSDPMELDSEVVVSCLVWALGSELSSLRKQSVLLSS